MAQFDHPVMDLPPDYYSAIGEFLFRSAQLEYQIHEIVWAAMGLGYQKGQILTMGSGIGALRPMIVTITRPDADVWVKNRTLIQQMNSIAKHARKHSDLRNHLADGSWQAPLANPKRANLHFMHEKDHRILPRIDRTLDHVRIKKHAEELRVLNVKAQELLERMNRERPTPQPQFA